MHLDKSTTCPYSWLFVGVRAHRCYSPVGLDGVPCRRSKTCVAIFAGEGGHRMKVLSLVGSGGAGSQRQKSVEVIT